MNSDKIPATNPDSLPAKAIRDICEKMRTYIGQSLYDSGLSPRDQNIAQAYLAEALGHGIFMHYRNLRRMEPDEQTPTVLTPAPEDAV